MSRQTALSHFPLLSGAVTRWGNRGVCPRIVSVSRSLAFYGIPPP